MTRGTAVHQLFESRDRQVLIEGPAGTGKSRGVLEKIHQCCEQHPGLMVWIGRKTRRSMTDTILPLFEKHVLPPGHEALGGGKPAPANRHSYRYANGSEIIVGGLDVPERTFSGEFDLMAVFEATECYEQDIEKLLRGLRASGGLGYNQLICDCNPSYATHWLNLRAMTDKMVRLKAKFADNPSIKPDYIRSLAGLGRVLKARLHDGIWLTAEGLIWQDYSSTKHLIHATLEQDARGGWDMWVPAWKEKIRLWWFFASVDWGFRAPTVLQVWGVDEKHRAFRVKEIYRTGKTKEWFADRAEELRKKFDIQRFECDPEDPEAIAIFNSRMRDAGGYGGARREELAGKAMNARKIGHDIVREMFRNDTIYLLDNANEHVDDSLRDARMPWKTEDEILAYCFAEDVDGRKPMEDAEKGAVDHGCDAMRYAMVWFNGQRPKRWNLRPEEDEYKKGTFGRMLGHSAVESIPLALPMESYL